MKFPNKADQGLAHSTQVFNKLAQVHPDPKCELIFFSPFQLLVSVVLSAQTTDKAVNRCMEPLYRIEFTPESVIAMGEDAFRFHIKSIGLAPTKARNVIGLAKIVLSKHGGKVPRRREELEALPGVGRKTASVVLGEIFGEPTLAVDTHVLRVSRRLGWHEEKEARKAEIALESIVDKTLLPKGHHWLILLGRYTCLARKPKCSSCPVSEICPSFGLVD